LRCIFGVSLSLSPQRPANMGIFALNDYVVRWFQAIISGLKKLID
jgi:hypothetical protein